MRLDNDFKQQLQRGVFSWLTKTDIIVEKYFIPNNYGIYLILTPTECGSYRMHYIIYTGMII